MSRSIDQEYDSRQPGVRPAIRVPDVRTLENPKDTASLRDHLARKIDTAAAGKPSMGEFIGRLEEAGVTVLPSIQSAGRLNGLSYRFKGVTFNGSSLGRAYTAHGVQSKLGIDYQPDRDKGTLADALARGGMRRETGDRSGEVRRFERHQSARSLDSYLTGAQHEALADIGKFRTVATADLTAYRYDGHSAKCERELRELSERGLVECRVITHGSKPKAEKVATLTDAGRNLLRRENPTTNGIVGQQYYAGFVKLSEMPHDVGIYRMYQQEAARIEREGGKVRRVVLDFELKKRLYAEVNRSGNDHSPEAPLRKAQIAAAHGLSVVGGRVVLPDLRIEYETKEQELAKVDLELVTDNYRESQIATKRAAGLKLYAPDASLQSPAHYDPEIASGLVSL